LFDLFLGFRRFAEETVALFFLDLLLAFRQFLEKSVAGIFVAGRRIFMADFELVRFGEEIEDFLDRSFTGIGGELHFPAVRTAIAGGTFVDLEVSVHGTQAVEQAIELESLFDGRGGWREFDVEGLHGSRGRSRCERLHGGCNRCGAHILAELAQFVADILGGLFVYIGTVLVAGELGPQHVARFEKGVDHFRAYRQLAFADAVEQGFQDVRHAGHVGETESTAAALDRMRRPEYGVEIVRVRVVDVEVEQQLLHFVQVFCGLLRKNTW